MGEGENKEGDVENPKKEEAAPPEEVVMRVYMHCEGCARKVKKILKRFDGVEEVITDPKASKVVVKGRKSAAEPMKLVERVKKKTGRKVELLSPLPTPVEEKKEEPEPLKPEEKEEPQVITVVLKVHMHCETCAEVIKKKILKLKGIQSAELDLEESELTVTGVFNEARLAQYVHRRTGKDVTIVKSELATASENAGDGNAHDGGGDGDNENADGSNGGGEENEQNSESNIAAMAAANQYMQYPYFTFPTGGGYCPPPPPPPPPSYIYPPPMQYGYAPPPPPPPPAYPPAYMPHIFSDENPHACSIM